MKKFSVKKYSAQKNIVNQIYWVENERLSNWGMFINLYNKLLEYIYFSQ
jgi:hypothetical protein